MVTCDTGETGVTRALLGVWGFETGKSVIGPSVTYTHMAKHNANFLSCQFYVKPSYHSG